MLVFVVLAMVVLLGMFGLAIDVGRAYFTQRALQASADAAALAGAQELPDPGSSVSVAHAYSGAAGGKNETKGVDGVSTNVTTRCLKSAPGCEPVNAVVVEQSAQVETLFAGCSGSTRSTSTSRRRRARRVPRSRSTSCSSSTAPARCARLERRADPSCTDLNNARDGMKTFLGFMDPSIDWVGLAVFPPGTTCGTPSTSAYNSTGSPYVIVPLSDDYWSNGDLDPDSPLVSTIDCQQGGGRTSYANAIEKAQGELDAAVGPRCRT